MPDVAVQSLGMIFTPFMVRAILNGKKTQTRRLINPQPIGANGHGPTWARYMAECDEWEFWGKVDPETKRALLYEHGRHKPRYAVGSRPWVKEAFVYRSKHDRYYFKADHPVYAPYAHNGWKSPRVMPKKASRITLEILDVRAQLLRDITEEDAVAEAVDYYSGEDVPRQATWSRRQDFAQLWDILHKRDKRPWKSNPWVWAYTFKVHEVRQQAVSA
jgi:hypothetical protein